VKAIWCRGVEIGGAEVDLAIDGVREHVDELDWPGSKRRRRPSIVPHIVADRARQRVKDLQHDVELSRGFALFQESEARAELAKDVGIGSGVTNGFDRRTQDRKSTRLNSSHVATSYAVF